MEKEKNTEVSDLKYIREGINGITHLNNGGVSMRNCMFAGFSGYGTTIGVSQDIHDCVFYECKIGIKELDYDSKIRRCWFSRGETAILCSWDKERVKYNTEPVGNTDANGKDKGIRYYLTLQVTDCWCDMMRGHFIHVEAKTPNEPYFTTKLLVNDNWVDMLDSSAIYVEGSITQSSITGSFSRIGMMWANPNGDARTSENTSECDIVNACQIHNSDIRVTTEMWNYANGQKRKIGHSHLHSTFQNLICPAKVAAARNYNTITETSIAAYDAPLENITDNASQMRNVRLSCGKTDITRQREVDLSNIYVLPSNKSLPSASATWLNMVVLFTNSNSSLYTKGAFYHVVATTEGGTTTYSWDRLDSGSEDIANRLLAVETDLASVDDMMNDVFIYSETEGINHNKLKSETFSPKTSGAFTISYDSTNDTYLWAYDSTQSASWVQFDLTTIDVSSLVPGKKYRFNFEFVEGSVYYAGVFTNEHIITEYSNVHQIPLSNSATVVEQISSRIFSVPFTVDSIITNGLTFGSNRNNNVKLRVWITEDRYREYQRYGASVGGYIFTDDFKKIPTPDSSEKTSIMGNSAIITELETKIASSDSDYVFKLKDLITGENTYIGIAGGKLVSMTEALLAQREP